MTSVAEAGERIEELLAALRARGGAAADTAEELVRVLVGMYGDGLAAIMTALSGEGAGGPGHRGPARRRPSGGGPVVAARAAPAGRGRPDPAGAGPGPAVPGLARRRGAVPGRERRRRPAPAGRNLPRLPLLDRHRPAGDRGSRAGCGA